MPTPAQVPLRGAVPSPYVRLLFEYLGARGHDAARLLGEPAPEPGDHGLSLYPVERWRGLLQTAAQALNDPLLGLHLGQTITAAHLGVMGYVLHACGTLGAALERFGQYERLIYDVNASQRRIDGAELVLEWGVEHGRPGALVDETAITALVQFARDLVGLRVTPSAVSFANPTPADTGPYRDYFGCPVHFSGASTVVRLPLAALAQPLRRADAHLLAVLEEQARRLLRDLPTQGYAAEVRQCIARLSRSGEPSLDAVAAELHCSTRTLHRRLEAEGTAFRPLLDDTRRRLAEDHLRDPRLSLAEIAGLLGYSEQSAFNRAFRRWTGVAPGSFRKATTSRI